MKDFLYGLIFSFKDNTRADVMNFCVCMYATKPIEVFALGRFRCKERESLAKIRPTTIFYVNVNNKVTFL